jgi:hypothetical protein
MIQRKRLIVPSAHGTRGPLYLLAAAGLSVVTAGCGGLPASVEGIVTLDGRPVPAARISFHPDAPGPVAYGMTLDDGVYSLKTGAKTSGLEAGSYRVTVFAMEAVDTPDEAGKRLTPEVYGNPVKTPLRVQVAKGANRIPLALESAVKASGERATSEAPAVAR